MESDKNHNEQPKKGNKNPLSFLAFASMLGELGFLIAIPLVIAILAGLYLDRKFHTLPLFVILGMLAAIATSAIAIGRKIKNLNKLNGI